MTDVSYVTSRVLVQTLMLEMKMEPTARAFVVSGFPRTMDDTMEYTEKVIRGFVPFTCVSLYRLFRNFTI